MDRRTLKRVAFTLHDYTLKDIKRLCELAKESQYLVLGYETCPRTGRRHVQGFVNLIKKAKFTTVKNKIGSKCHIEQANGSDEQNKKYCEKEGASISFGEPSTQGQRNDLKKVVETLLENDGVLSVVAERHPEAYVRYFRGLRELRDVVRPPPSRNFKTHLLTFVGEPGGGKSYFASQMALLYTNVYYKTRGPWWDGYVQQPIVIIDDFYGWIKYDELLKITDRYPYQVPIKGGFQVFNSQTIIITSNKRVEDWYKFDGYDPTALLRRHIVYSRLERHTGPISEPCLTTDEATPARLKDYDGLVAIGPDFHIRLYAGTVAIDY